MGSLPVKTFVWSLPSSQTGGSKIFPLQDSQSLVITTFHPHVYFFKLGLLLGKWHYNFLCGFTTFAGFPPMTRFLRMCVLFLTPQDSLGKNDFIRLLSLRKEEIVSLWFWNHYLLGKLLDYLCHKNSRVTANMKQTRFISKLFWMLNCAIHLVEKFWLNIKIGLILWSSAQAGVVAERACLRG